MEIQCLKTAEYEMEYFCFGSGKPFVIIPGVSVKPITCSAAAVAAGFADFAAKYTVYVFDRRKAVPPGHSVSDMADDLIAAMRALGLSGADVFGASQGGMIAQLVAARAPELVRRLVLGSTLARQNRVSLAVFARWRQLAEAGVPAPLNRDITEKVYSEAFRTKYRRAFAHLENEGTPEELQRFAVLAEACRSFDASGELEKIACPVLVIGAAQDHVLTGEASEELAQALSCPLYIYEDYGHAVYDEAPDYRARLLRFFAG